MYGTDATRDLALGIKIVEEVRHPKLFDHANKVAERFRAHLLSGPASLADGTATDESISRDAFDLAFSVAKDRLTQGVAFVTGAGAPDAKPVNGSWGDVERGGGDETCVSG